MRQTLEDILTHHGHTVLQTRNGQECLEVLRRESVDVCLPDIVMLSAMSQENTVKLALQLGADAFVVKPFQESSLIERIG